MSADAWTPGSILDYVNFLPSNSSHQQRIINMYTVSKFSGTRSAHHRDRDQAHAAWSRKYGTLSVTLDQDADPPFIPGRYLGEGGFSQVHETKLGDTVVALKRTRIRGRLRPEHTAEIDLLEKMSQNQHQHIIEVIGAYTIPGRRSTELGILLLPVAPYDLSRLLTHTELLWHIWTTQLLRFDHVSEDQNGAFSELREFIGLPPLHTEQSQFSRLEAIHQTCQVAQLRLQKSIGCIARAVQYLHVEQHIRHKDLKPSQILFSAHGLWLTDFGWSLDVSEAENSATFNGDRTTLKYEAPERHAMEPCGRAEDVFGLGCIFLEIALVAGGKNRDRVFNPHSLQRWSYHANLQEKEHWLEQLPISALDDTFTPFRSTLSTMLERNPQDRPKISTVIEELAKCHKHTTGTRMEYPFFEWCCHPRSIGNHRPVAN